MSKLSRYDIRKIILKEISKMKEDALYTQHKVGHDYRAAKHSMCAECGSKVYEGESSCSECGAMYENYLNEGCGCGTCAGCSGGYDSDTDDNFIPDDMENQSSDDLTSLLNQFLSVNTEDYEDIDHSDNHHYSGAYMAKSQLYKVAKYAEKLYSMIPEGHDLEDWMRTKIAQIADDIGEVYHALDHDIYEGDV